MSIKPFPVAFLVFAWLSIPSAAVNAGGFSNPDTGGRRMGMLSVVGKPDDVTAIYHNPAGMLLLDGTQLYHGQSWFFVDLGIRMYDSKGVLHPDHEIKPKWNVGLVPFFGATSDLGTEDWRVGLAVYAPNAYGAALSDKEPVRYHATDALFLASRAAFAVAWKPSERLYLSIGVDLVHVLLWAKRFMNVQVLANPDARFNDYETMKASDAELEINGQDWTWAMNLGLLFLPTDRFSVGISFSGGSDINMTGDVHLKSPKEGGGTVTESTTQSTRFTIPFTLRTGINWEFARDFEWGFDILFWHYQVLQEQVSVLASPLMGISEFRDPKNYTNCWAWNTGLLHRIHPDVELMVGYQQDYTPIPTQTYTLDNPTRNSRGISFGSRWQVSKKTRLGLAFVRNWYELADVQDSVSIPPSNVKGYGSNFEVALEVMHQL